MKDSDLLFNILTAAALGVVIILAPTAGRAAADEASGLCIGAGVGQSDIDTSCGVAGAVTTAAVRTIFGCGPSV
jgi:hypothetical protein